MAETEGGPSSGAGEVAAAAEEATEAAGEDGVFKAYGGMYRYCGGGGAGPDSFLRKEAGRLAPTPPPIVFCLLHERLFQPLTFLFQPFLSKI